MPLGLRHVLLVSYLAVNCDRQEACRYQTATMSRALFEEACSAFGGQLRKSHLLQKIKTRNIPTEVWGTTSRSEGQNMSARA